MTKARITCDKVADNMPGACVLDEAHGGRHQDSDGYTWDGTFKYGRPDVYEITWMSGHIETVLAHQVMHPHAGLTLGGLSMAPDQGPPRVRIYAEIDGHWVVTLAAREEDIRTMRLITGGERIPGGPLPEGGAS